MSKDQIEKIEVALVALAKAVESGGWQGLEQNIIDILRPPAPVPPIKPLY